MLSLVIQCYLNKYHKTLLSHSVVPDSLGPYGLQHARLPCSHHLLEFAQTHVHGVDDAMQTSHSLPPPSPAHNLLVYNYQHYL